MPQLVDVYHRIGMGAATRKAHGDVRTCFLLFALAFLANVVSGSTAPGPDDIAALKCLGTGASSGRLKCLAKAYAPLLKFDSGEAFFPLSVDGFLPYVKLINADGSDVPNQPNRLRSSNLVYKSATPLTTFLTTKEPPNETEIDPSFMFGQKPTKQSTVPIYVSIVSQQAGKLYDFVYYTFYPYNHGKPVANRVFGNHVGDWEHVTLRISFRNSPQPRLVQAFTSQHSGEECLAPSNISFVARTSHSIFYVAKGSHGSYNMPDDHDGANAVEWATWNNVAVRVQGPPLAKNYRWWGYNGRWGNRQGLTSFLGQFILENGPAYPGVHTLTFQLDLPALENCPVL